MKSILLGIALVFGFSAHAQNTFTIVNRDEVKKALSGDSAITSYAKLTDRFNAFDTTMSLRDYRLLYYGFVFQDTYSSNPAEKKKEILEALKAKRFDEANKLCDSVLSTYPVSLAANYYKGVALYQAHSNKPDYLPYKARFDNLLRAIFSSGDGLTCETGFRVISVSDEYMIIYNFIKTDNFYGQSLIDHCDLLKIKPAINWPRKEIYFDASEILKKEADLFK
jgi:hypothetical protein